MQEWRWSSFVPPRLHDWNRFIRPAELDLVLWREGLSPEDMVGLVPGTGPVGMIRAVRDRKKGRISYAEFGRRVALREGKDLSVSYMGYALRAPKVAAGARRRRSAAGFQRPRPAGTP